MEHLFLKGLVIANIAIIIIHILKELIIISQGGIVAPWSLSSFIPWMIIKKTIPISNLEPKMRYWAHCQSIMFDLPPHKVTYDKHIACLSNPLNNNGT